MNIDVYSQEGEKIDNIELDERVFDGKVKEALMHQAIVTFLANQREGLASSKTRGEVRGGGRKPWRQKGTGRARSGSRRSPLWHGGGITFGPKPRSYHKKMPQKMRIAALKSALNAKVIDGEILIVNNISLKDHKTKALSEILNKFKLNGLKITLAVDIINGNLKLAARNIDNLYLEKAGELNAYTALDCNKLLLTINSIKAVENRIKKWLS